MQTINDSLEELFKDSAYRYSLGDYLTFVCSHFSLEIDFSSYPSDDVDEVAYRGEIFFARPITDRLDRFGIKMPGWYRICWEDFEQFFEELELPETLALMASQKNIDCFDAIIVADDFKRELYSVIAQAAERAWAKEVMINSSELEPRPDYDGLEEILKNYSR